MAFPDGTADFRSDTVTRPSGEMRRAMAAADVGDDVYGEDPTVNALQEACAESLGKEAGLFVPSGSMANLIGLNLLTSPGDEVLCVEKAHLRNYEAGSASAVSGVSFRTVPVSDGRVTFEAVDDALTRTDYHNPPVSVLAWENTHNASGGTVTPLAHMESVSARARAGGLRIHLDGARIWNAAAAAGVPASSFAAVADTVVFCFSKGLGAPVGSILCASEDLVARGRVLRKRFGGGMRQVGVLAAAARVGFDDRARLADDHDLAQRLAAGLADRFPDAVPPAETNMVLVHEAGLPGTAADLQIALAAAGILVAFIETGVLRFCTHRDVDGRDVERLLGVVDDWRR